MENKIKEIYSDALYWATSPKSKMKPYHLTRLEESILRKLIHYEKSNEKKNNKSKISFSNDLIAHHTFLSISQIKKCIPQLEKLGYIKCSTNTFRNDSYEIRSRRYMSINWDLIQLIYNDVPKEPFKG